MRVTRVVPVVALALALAATPLAGAPHAAVATPAPVAGAHGPGDSLLPHQGNGGYNVLHYGIVLHYRSKTSITARTTIRARAYVPLSSFSLDLQGLTVSSVVVDGRAAAFTRSGTKLVITPSRAVSGQFSTTVRYHGKPVTHTDPDGSKDGWIRTAHGATVLSEPVGAMTWFPDNNTPRDKATFYVAVRVPAGLQVAGNGDLVSHRRHGSTATWVWRQRHQMAPYVAMISIGHYTLYSSSMRTVSGHRLPIWTFIERGLGRLAAQRAALPKIVRAQERRSGPYPFTSVGIVVADVNSHYSLETQNRPVFDGVPSTGKMVHELAHQWYGDSVGIVDWGDIWLNEGFAGFTKWQWNAEHDGRRVTSAFHTAYRAAPASLWSPAPAALTNASQLFSDEVYDRGRMTLGALRQRVGAHDFNTIIQRWATLHRYRAVRTAQFVALSEQVSGDHLQSFFRAWLYTPRKPALP